LLILVSGSESPIRHFGTSNLGGLITPQFLRTGQVYNRLGVSWAMDNDCFVSLKRMALTKMWLASQPIAKTCLWAVVPDVVGNAGATLTGSGSGRPSCGASAILWLTRLKTALKKRMCPGKTLIAYFWEARPNLRLAR
jgi:hypothetical protein